MIRSQASPSRLVGPGLAILLIMGLAACGGPPKWVEKGSGAFNEKDSKAFYGVGAVSGVRNIPLAWDTAENRGRAEIAKTFETYTGYLIGAMPPRRLPGILPGIRKSRMSSEPSRRSPRPPSAESAKSISTWIPRPIPIMC
ncbi:MAG: hypothetical protein QM706_00695 [Nitrospira sp.]